MTPLAAKGSAPFLLHALQFLRPGGAMGMVVPSELAQTSYGPETLRTLCASFGRVQLISFCQSWFEDAQQEAFLLLAQDRGRRCASAALTPLERIDDLARFLTREVDDGNSFALSADVRVCLAFLPAETRVLYQGLVLPRAAATVIKAAFSEADRGLRGNDFAGALRIADALILDQVLGLGAEAQRQLTDGRAAHQRQDSRIRPVSSSPARTRIGVRPKLLWKTTMPTTRRASALLLLCLLVIWSLVALAAEPGRQLIVVDGADYFGHDYETLKEVSLDDCKQACLDDARCRAFTFNTAAGWCFLKTDYADLRPFDGAVSGRIASAGAAPSRREADAQRHAELVFLPRAYRDEAAELRRRVAEAGDGMGGGFDQLIADARAATRAGQVSRAVSLYEAALRLAPDDHALWLRLASTARDASPSDWSTRQRMREEATAAAINAYLTAASIRERAAAMVIIARSLEERSAWQPSIRAYRAALALRDDASLQRHLDDLVANHGFRITSHEVDSDAAEPRICIRFSQPLARGDDVHLADYLKLPRADLAIEPEAQQLCVDGVRHGERYKVLVRAGLPADDGERLSKAVELDVYVRDRSPAVRFPGRAYVLPSGGDAVLPMVTVNTERVAATLSRIGDRALGDYAADETLLTQLSSYDAEQLRDLRGEQLWTGEIEVRPSPAAAVDEPDPDLNREVTTQVPVGQLIEQVEPGAYVLTAKPAESTDDELATQWFVISDLGLTALSGNDGLHALVRSLSTAEPLANVQVRLIALNQQVLGEAQTDALGHALLPPGLLLGTGGNAPSLLVASRPDGDYGFLDLRAPPFDLTDRGVDGREPPRSLDVYLAAERGIYRPGEQVALTALARDAKARAVTGVPLTFVIARPDGVEHLRTQVDDQGLGGRVLRLTLRPDAMRGTWQARVYADPKGEVLAQQPFLVEDFLPERLDFSLDATAKQIDPADPPSLSLDARFLYGAPASGLAVEGQTKVSTAGALADWPRWRFGLADEQIEPKTQPLPAAETDDKGHAVIAIALPDLAPATRLLQAEVSLRVLDGGGRPVERELTLPLRDPRPRIGVRPLFDGAVDEGGNAGFDVIALDADGKPIATEGLRWTLSRVHTSYQWYQTGGSWKFEPVKSRSRVAAGRLDTAAGEHADLARIEAAVDWGGYELTVVSADNRLLPVSVDFEAGWYVAPKAFDTPDLLKVSLDKPAYRRGETARVRLEPRFPGLALVMVVDDGIAAMQPVAVPEDGATVDLPVTDAWGPGAYVTAILYRGMDLEAKRMPKRAIGLQWAGVDPGDRKLALALDLPEQVRPRGPLPISIALDGPAPSGPGPIHVVVAAVDNGILNLTGFKDWAPGDWYFGQRRLGLMIRDIYGRLIDRMIGEPGRVRSGGDAMPLTRFDGPPPSEALVAFHSGILDLDDAGRAKVEFPLPDFNGSVRVMAMAWSEAGVGQTADDVLVRDPVVMNAALPRFLAPGDRSRMLVELAHVEGPAGAMALTATSDGDGLQLGGDSQPMTVDVPESGRTQISLPLTAAAVGDHRIRLMLETPDGQQLTKQLTLGVRSLEPPVRAERQVRLAPDGPELVLDQDLAAATTAQWSGLLPDSGSWLVSISGAGAIDVPGIVRELDRYPYGCTEQLTSRALPLLYLDQVAATAGLAATAADDGDDEDSAAQINKRIDDAIASVLGNQSGRGGFGVWGPGSSDLWLDAYVTDFMTRAREQGHEVPKTAFTIALDNLNNQVGYAPDFNDGGEGIAYALYVLARNSRATLGDLRYYQETKLDDFATPMARAQLGAALALYGEQQRAALALRSAHDLWRARAADDDDGWRPDYGSLLRDGAALLTLTAESGTEAIAIDSLGGALAERWQAADWHSTQDQAWLLLAAHALMDGAASPRLRIDGEAHQGPFYRALGLDDLAAAPLVIRNVGPRPLDALINVTGTPLRPPPAQAAGYRIERAYYDLDGRRADPGRADQGERRVVLLTISADKRRAARLIVNDPLPAGYEIDNPTLVSSGAIDGLPWLNVVTQPAHTAFRAERFVAAVDRDKGDPSQFQLAYVVRAVSPGDFAHPAAQVEDMYRPSRRGRTNSGRVEIRPPQ